MDVIIRKISSLDADKYIEFFDYTAHDTKLEKDKCYCVGWNDSNDNLTYSDKDTRRTYAHKYVIEEKITGYIAELDNKIIGWVNVNHKTNCSQCANWKNYMSYVPMDQKKVLSIYCFVVNEKYYRQGIASQLLKKVIEDAIVEDYDLIESYPYEEKLHGYSNFGGYVSMYEKEGFKLTLKTEYGLVMQKKLK
ncbi:GNAT family N-acetyltransferase [Acholeplasma hippikon]|nr:GNAT family N-acetyltransferase [Acholeplasma hippikon]